jgi:glutathione S-transferase
MGQEGTVIRLYQFEISPFCDKIRRILHVKGQAYEAVEVPLSRAGRDVRGLDPAGKLPVIEHEGRVVADSTDIAHYLEERFPEPALLPRDPRERALCHVFEDWADESLYFYEMRLRFTFPRNARRWIPRLVAHDPGWMQGLAPLVLPRAMRRLTRAQGVGRKSPQQVLADVTRHLDAVDALLEGSEWLVGAALSLADIAVFAQLFCVRGADEGAELVAARPAVAAWMERVERATEAPPA